MTGVNVQNTMADFAVAKNAAVGAQKTANTGVATDSDFHEILNQTQQKQQTPTAAQKKQDAARDGATQQKDAEASTKQADKTDTSKEESKTDQVADKEQKVKQHEKAEASTSKADADAKAEADEELEEAVEKALEQIVTALTDMLGVSEEELAAAMEELGLQPLDLLQTENMAQLVAVLTGENSTIGLVTNEELYQDLQALVQTVEEQLSSLSDELQLSPEDVQQVLDQLAKQLEEMNQMPEQEAETALPKELPVQDMEAPEELMKQPAEQTADKIVPITVKRDGDAGQIEQPLEQTVEKTETVQTQETETRPQQEENKNFDNQQNMPQNQQLQQSTEANATQAQSTTSLPNTESILKQLADFVKIQTGKELTEMELQLHPASLGTVHVQLSTKGGIVTAQLTTQNETVKTAIESQIVELKSNLEEQGIKIEAIEVSVASHELERGLDQNNQDRQENGEEQKSDNIRKIRRMNLNLNELGEGDMAGLDEADEGTRLTAEMMAINGGTMDLLA